MNLKFESNAGSMILDALIFDVCLKIEIDAIDCKTIKRSAVNPCVGQMTSENANVIASPRIPHITYYM